MSHSCSHHWQWVYVKIEGVWVQFRRCGMCDPSKDLKGPFGFMSVRLTEGEVVNLLHVPVDMQSDLLSRVRAYQFMSALPH